MRQARLTRATGAVTLIQRFGSALNLNIHFHLLMLDGAYVVDTGPAVFRRIAAPGEAELQARVERLAQRIGVEADQRQKLERLARYVSRPPVAVARLALTAQGQVRYRLKTPYRDGTTHIVLEPLDFIARLAALVPPPRVHLTRYHGVFAPHAALRALVTPAGRGPRARSRVDVAESPTPRHQAMTWAQRLKRVFRIEIEGCARCGGRLKAIASIEDPEVIARILAHRRARGAEDAPVASLGPRAPPAGRSGRLF